MSKTVYYHAGCPVCVEAERTLLPLLNREVEVVHLGGQSPRVAEAEAAGVKSVPALVVDGQVLHLNFGAALADLK
ncbi:glutaredoxin family protein [Pseudomonas nitroreducens]|uniref:Thioredoxin family protein n=1 Tax=Pseudomonas nitroreducens TaxID=46680 RepID=A0A246FBK5_PSENT|nr:thioredoxin family protein [Pseudomonas nitroreducens]OWP51693.1 thioredoxin family protein [Pseudomonas nitroreducens]